MATVVRELVATFELDVDNASFNKAESSIDSIIGAAKVLGALFIGGAVAEGFSRLIDFASDATEDLNLLTVVFGEELTPAITEWAKTTARSMNQSEFELRRFVGTSQAMLAPMLGNADAAAQFSTEIVEAAIDLRSLRNVAGGVPAAFQKITAALSGESEPLRRLGIDTREAAFDQFLMAEGIAQTNKDLPVQQRNLQRVRFVLDSLKASQGDAAKTSEDFANVQQGIDAGMTDIATKIGKIFLPAMTRTAIATRDTLRAVLDWVDANELWLSQNIGGAFSAFIQVIDNTARGLGMAARFAVGLFEKLSPLQQGILAVTASIIALIAVMSLPFAPIFLLIALIGLLIDDLVTFGDGGKSVFGDLVTSVTEFAASAGIDLGGFFEFVTDGWDSISEAIAAFSADGLQGIVDFAKTAIEVIKGFFDNSEEEGEGFFTNLGTKLLEFVKSISSGPLGKALLAAVGGVVGTVVGGKIGKIFGPKAQLLLSAAGGIGGGLLGAQLPDLFGGDEAAAGAPDEAGGGIFSALGNLASFGQVASAAGAALTNNNDVSATFNITQREGEDSEGLANLVTDKLGGLVSDLARDVQENFGVGTAQ